MCGRDNDKALARQSARKLMQGEAGSRTVMGKDDERMFPRDRGGVTAGAECPVPVIQLGGGPPGRIPDRQIEAQTGFRLPDTERAKARLNRRRGGHGPGRGKAEEAQQKKLFQEMHLQPIAAPSGKRKRIRRVAAPPA